MIAKDRRRGWKIVVSAATGLLVASSVSHAQTNRNTKPSTTKTSKSAPADDQTITVKETRLPVRATDAVAIVNGEPITRQKLSDEAVIREGERVLDAMISKLLVEQEIRKMKLEVTPAEVDQEISKIAGNFGVTRERWLSSLAKERKISPSQYANDIIYPGLALRKIAAPRVTVSDKDMKDAYDAYYGEKLKVRMIMTTDQKNAIAISNELAKNPDGFAFIAQNDPRSIDQSTKSMAGLLDQDLTRHAYPREVSDAAFEQLVDGDPKDKDPTHKPKNGMISGPIQVHEAWVIFKRENLTAAQIYDPKDEAMRNKLRDLIFEAKVKDEMSKVLNRIYEASAIENHLTGQSKLANEDQNSDSKLETSPNLMADRAAKGNTKIVPIPATGNAKPGTVGGGSVKPEDRATRDELLKTIGNNPPK